MSATEPTGWILQEEYACDGCGATVVCLYDGTEHWQFGAIGLGDLMTDTLHTFCAACADSAVTPDTDGEPADRGSLRSSTHDSAEGADE